MVPPVTSPNSALEEQRAFKIDSPTGSGAQEPVFSVHERPSAVERVLTHQPQFRSLVHENVDEADRRLDQLFGSIVLERL